MLSIFFDGLGEQLLNATNDAITHLQERSGQNILYRLLCLLPLLILKFVKAVIISPIIIGGSRLITFWVPWYRDGFKELLIHSIPSNLRCFSKIGLLIYFIDFYCLAVCVNRLFVNRAAITYIYLILKAIMLVLPFMYISPLERFPSWVLGAALVVFEIPIAFFVIHCVGRGIDWNSGQSFYHHWGPHYRYRRMTTNRKFTLDISWYLYPAFKITVLGSFICYNPHVAEFRLKYPWVPTRAELASVPSTGCSINPTDTGCLPCSLPTGCSINPADAECLTCVAATPNFEQSVSALPGLDYISAFTEADTVVNMRYGVLFLLALSSLSVYSIILAGWASNSKYAFIGALRSAAQMISYEVAISLILLPVVLMAGSLNLSAITYMQSITIWFVFPLLPAAVLFLIAMLAETNRTPFDLPEAEAELVAGYNVDYSSLPFAMFFLGEYCNMILISVLYCLLFLGGGLSGIAISSSLILAGKAAFIWVFFVVVRATLPRYRYDQLMDIGWKVFLPIAGGFLVFVFGLLLYCDAIPYTTELPFNTWVSEARTPSYLLQLEYEVGYPAPPVLLALLRRAPRITAS